VVRRKENEQGQNANTKVSRKVAEIETHTQARMQEAQSHYDKGELVEAMDVLNNAYLSLKLSLVKLRDGKTLVRSLHFETKEDEYRYELRRNDTHNMLINTVLKKKRADPRLGKLMDIPLKEADKLRAEAEKQADSKKFETAIKTLEESTKHIIRAIRMAGIFIPG
jgi:predicted negative regulator of RcsB-dependent stress response